MKHLPQYWAIKIEQEHPLWKRFVAELMLSYTGVRDDIFEEWKYVLKDENNIELNFGNKPYSNFTEKSLQLITIEEFFGDVSPEIY